LPVWCPSRLVRYPTLFGALGLVLSVVRSCLRSAFLDKFKIDDVVGCDPVHSDAGSGALLGRAGLHEGTSFVITNHPALSIGALSHRVVMSG